MSQYGEKHSRKWDPGTNFHAHYMFIKSLLPSNKSPTCRLLQLNSIMKTRATQERAAGHLISSISTRAKGSNGLPLGPQELRVQFSIWQNQDFRDRCGLLMLQSQVLSGVTPSILQTTGCQVAFTLYSNVIASSWTERRNKFWITVHPKRY